MMGMSSPEWSRYMAEALACRGRPEEINAAIVERMLARTARRRRSSRVRSRRCGGSAARLAARDRVLVEPRADRRRARRVAGLAGTSRATVSSEEVPRGKPSPDVYLEAARRLGVDPARCGAVEDSHNGIRSAKAAGMRVVAVPNPHYPPDDEALELADVVVRRSAGYSRALRRLADDRAGVGRTRLEAVIDRLEVDDDDVPSVVRLPRPSSRSGRLRGTARRRRSRSSRAARVAREPRAPRRRGSCRRRCTRRRPPSRIPARARGRSRRSRVARASSGCRDGASSRSCGHGFAARRRSRAA